VSVGPTWQQMLQYQTLFRIKLQVYYAAKSILDVSRCNSITLSSKSLLWLLPYLEPKARQSKQAIFKLIYARIQALMQILLQYTLSRA
jgi:hypothetical protein